MAKKTLSKRELRIRRKRRRRRIVFALEILVLLVLVVGLFLYAKLGEMNFEELNFENIQVNTGITENKTLKGYTTIGLIGLDNRENGESTLNRGNSDTMIIASINNDTKEVKLVSIYRDTYLRIGQDEEKNGIYRKANEAYARGGKEQFVSMVNTNLDLNVQDTIAVDFSAVAKTAELLGGIDMQLSEAEIVHLNNYCVETSKVTGMDYEPIPNEPGIHHLNGVQTVAYARIRYTAGNDFRRAARQREVIAKLVEKAKSSDLATLNSIVDEIFPMISTTLSKSEIIKMGMSMLSYEIVDQAGFPFDHLYGENVKNAMDGYDCVLPVTLESNVIKLHQFLYGTEDYQISQELKNYSDHIVKKSGYGIESQLSVSEDGNMEDYWEQTKGN